MTLDLKVVENNFQEDCMIIHPDNQIFMILSSSENI